MDVEEKRKLLMKRASELQDMMREGKGDARELLRMMKLGEIILQKLEAGLPVRFYRVIEPLVAPVFFCPQENTKDS